jgi:predicted Zn-ribbon and HTH transcriptional regulator
MSKKTKEKETGDEIENVDPQIAFNQAMIKWYVKDVSVEANALLKYSGREIKYADLSNIIKAVKKSLAEDGLRITFKPYFCKETGDHYFQTKVLHVNGGFESVEDMLPKWNRIQDHGGNYTYLKRYHMSMLLCLDTDADLDGNERGCEPGESKPLEEKVKPKKKKPVHPDLTALNLKIQETHNFKISAEETLKILGINSLSDVSSMPGDNWSKLTKKLDDELNKRKANLHKGGN